MFFACFSIRRKFWSASFGSLQLLCLGVATSCFTTPACTLSEPVSNAESSGQKKSAFAIEARLSENVIPWDAAHSRWSELRGIFQETGFVVFDTRSLVASGDGTKVAEFVSELKLFEGPGDSDFVLAVMNDAVPDRYRDRHPSAPPVGTFNRPYRSYTWPDGDVAAHAWDVAKGLQEAHVEMAGLLRGASLENDLTVLSATAPQQAHCSEVAEDQRLGKPHVDAPVELVCGTVTAAAEEPEAGEGASGLYVYGRASSAELAQELLDLTRAASNSNPKAISKLRQIADSWPEKPVFIGRGFSVCMEGSPETRVLGSQWGVLHWAGPRVLNVKDRSSVFSFFSRVED